jgi:hypothetical protein
VGPKGPGAEKKQGNNSLALEITNVLALRVKCSHIQPQIISWPAPGVAPSPEGLQLLGPHLWMTTVATYDRSGVAVGQDGPISWQFSFGN